MRRQETQDKIQLTGHAKEAERNSFKKRIRGLGAKLIDSAPTKAHLWAIFHLITN